MGWIEFDSLTGDPLLDCDYDAEMWYRKRCHERIAKLRATELKEKLDPCMYPFAVCTCGNCERRWAETR